MNLSTPELRATLVEHGYRGAQAQSILRAVLVAFVALTVALAPPMLHRTSSVILVICYAVWAVAVWLLIHRQRLIRFLWLSLFADVAVLAILTLLADASAGQSGTAEILADGFFLIPLLAATQLRVWVCAAVAVPTVAVYLLTSIVTGRGSAGAWSSIMLDTMLLTGLAVGGVLLSRVQRSRVSTITELVADRTNLLSELLGVEDRERRNLAETLHDGALQYVLAARMDLEDLPHLQPSDSYQRVDHALNRSAQLLRSIMTQLHPEVLQHAGLLPALHDLASTTRTRSGVHVEVTAPDWDADERTSADPLLLRTAQELVVNVVKHAEATSAHIELARQGPDVLLRVTDNGRGITDGQLTQRLREGHIGLASRRIRLEAAGGHLNIRPEHPTGTIVEVRVPATVIP